jgi:hypothetical protein
VRTLKMIIVAVVRVVCWREGETAVEVSSGEVVREAKPCDDKWERIFWWGRKSKSERD